jgi:hypothetical protein
MTKPRKKKRKTGRPLENVPLRKLVSSVRRDIDEKVKMAFSDKTRKRQHE